MVWQIYSSREFSELSELVKDKADDSKSIYIYIACPPSTLFSVIDLYRL